MDPELGLIYFTTGNPGPDFDRHVRLGDNLFADSLVCIDARTGQRVWHYQVVRHDLWDRDFPSPPSLVTVTHGGRRIDALGGTLAAIEKGWIQAEIQTAAYEFQQQVERGEKIVSLFEPHADHRQGRRRCQ